MVKYNSKDFERLEDIFLDLKCYFMNDEFSYCLTEVRKLKTLINKVKSKSKGVN